jgi:hypothetical protein
MACQDTKAKLRMACVMVTGFPMTKKETLNTKAGGMGMFVMDTVFYMHKEEKTSVGRDYLTEDIHTKGIGSQKKERTGREYVFGMTEK